MLPLKNRTFYFGTTEPPKCSGVPKLLAAEATRSTQHHSGPAKRFTTPRQTGFNHCYHGFTTFWLQQTG